MKLPRQWKHVLWVVRSQHYSPPWSGSTACIAHTSGSHDTPVIISDLQIRTVDNVWSSIWGTSVLDSYSGRSRIILKLFLMTCESVEWFIWLRIGVSSVHLFLTRKDNFLTNQAAVSFSRVTLLQDHLFQHLIHPPHSWERDYSLNISECDFHPVLFKENLV
jgi:hypothetical protein